MAQYKVLDLLAAQSRLPTCDRQVLLRRWWVLMEMGDAPASHPLAGSECFITGMTGSSKAVQHLLTFTPVKTSSKEEPHALSAHQATEPDQATSSLSIPYLWWPN